MEKPGHVTKQHRKGWLTITVILSCFLIGYWVIKNNHIFMTTDTTTTVKGVVFKSATGVPVEGAIVMIADGDYEHPDIAAQTDEQGTFYLLNVHVPGTYSLLITYSTESKKVTVNVTKDSFLRIPL